MGYVSVEPCWLLNQRAELKQFFREFKNIWKRAAKFYNYKLKLVML